ncbi:hemicentin-1-like isoform X2 [Homarus americanus]|uniref:hemicentin-1-like isoform X2 n=1 Tax=Homarus americanus TaxID=6706 RepID=UPI001C4876F5|nr:hemicentin-1-like isoform X2 [Homarus americanus]
MVIKDATLEDAGRYECRVDFMRAPSKTTTIEVSVVEPPSTLQVKRTTGETVTYTVTVNEGSQIQLSCIVTGGRPRPRVWWTLRKDLEEKVVDETYESLESDLTQNNLMLPRLEYNLHQARLTCYASNTNATSPLSSPLTLLLNMAPRTVKITGLTSPLLAERRYRVGCETTGSRPAPNLTWTIKRPERLEEVIATEKLSTKNVSRSWLEVKVRWNDHGATLRCSASSPALPERVVTNSSTFDVHFSPRLQLNLGRMLQPDGIKEEMDVYFHCSVTANPKVYKVTWYHNNVEVQQDPSAGVLVSDDHLVLQKIKRRWSGSYVCRASNVVGDSQSEPLNITVRYAPICASTSTAVFRAALGEEIILPCRVLSHPRNVSFSWTFMNTLTEHERVPGERVSWKGLESRLRYLPEKTQDYGTLHCWASNVVGHQKEPCVFTIKPAGVPSKPQNCTVSNQTWESVEVTCGDLGGMLGHHRGYGGYDYNRLGYEDVPTPSNPAELLQDKDKPRYLLTVQERKTLAVVHNVTGERGLFSVTGLTPGLDYIILLFRYNSHGRSANVTLETFTLRTAENRMREEEEGGESALLGMVLGVIGVVLLLAVGAIVITLRSRSRPRSSTPTETTRLPPGETNDSTGLDHPDLLEAESHAVPTGPYRPTEVTQALLSPARPMDEEMSLTPTSVSPTAHLDYLPREVPEALSPSVRSHPRLYVRAEGHTGQQESFL